MDDSHKILPELIDERIDKRVALLSDSIELKLTKELDDLLKARFETTAKILGWAFGLVAIVFAGFGIKTLFDVRDVARTTAIDEVKKKLAIDDPNSEFRRDVDKIVARGLLDSYLLAIAKSRGERFAPDVTISETDLRRLLELLGDSRSSDKDFTDACEVLVRSSQMRREQSLERVFVDLGGAADPYRWVSAQPEKRAVVFRLYRGQRLVSSARAILNDANASKTLVLAAIAYSVNSNDAESTKSLERIAQSKDEDLSLTALNGLARLVPRSAILKDAIARLTASERDEDWASAIRLASEVAKPSSRRLLEDDPEEKVRLNISSRVIEQAIERNMVFRLSTGFGERAISSLAISSRKDFSTLYSVSSDLIQGGSSGALHELLQQSGSNDSKFAKAIRALCLEDEGVCWGVVRARLDNGGSVVLRSGVHLDKVSAPAGIAFRPASAKPEADILVSWTDSSAIRQTGTLGKVIESPKIYFEITSSKGIGMDDQDEQ